MARARRLAGKISSRKAVNLGRLKRRAECGGDVGWDEMRDVAAEFCDLFDEAGAGVAELLVWHDEEGFHLRFQMAVHQSHVEFELEVGQRSQAADDGVGLLLHAKFDEQAAEGGHGDIGELGDVGANHGDALLCGEERGFAGVFRDGDRHAIEKTGGTGEHIEVSAGDGVKSSRVDAMAHGRERGSLGKTGALPVAMRFWRLRRTRCIS